jgi:dienelactone hydrolase
LYAAVQRFRDMHGPRDGDFAGYVSFYPACHIRYRDDERLVDRPVHVLHGTADDMNPIERCRDFVTRARQAGANIQLHEFAEARHIFDWPLLGRPVILQGVRSNSGGLLVEREPGAIYLNDTDISEADAMEHFALNPSLAYDATAFAASKRIVADFITQVLQN